MDTADTSFDAILCPVCSRQIPNHINIYQSYPTLTSIHSNNQDDPTCFAHDRSGAIPPRAQHLVHDVMSKAAIQLSSAKVPSSDTTCHTIHAPDPAHPFNCLMGIDETAATLYCSDQCRLTDHQSYHSTIDVEYNFDRSTSPRAPPAPPNSPSNIFDSQDDGDCLSDAPLESLSSASSPVSDCAVNAYLRLSAIYGFAPLPPPPPFSPKVATSAKQSAPRLEGGIIMAARRIQAALCTEKYTKSFWGLPTYGDRQDDNKPIPGWTDGSNAWRASVYGLAPPRDFTRTDPDHAAIRAYGSYVATPHHSQGVHSTPNKDRPVLEAQATCPPSIAFDASTQDLYRKYCALFTRRSRSRTSTYIRGDDLSTSPTGTTCCSPHEVSLLKPGAEGRLLVPDVKMRVVDSTFSRVDGKSNSFIMAGEHRTASQRSCDAGPAASRTRSYQSEPFAYPIMPVGRKMEMRVEHRVIDGVERDVEVEVLIEEPIKRLFLFGGARD